MIRGPIAPPREAWRQQIGGLQSRNNFVCDGSRLFVSTCGEAWNVRDRHDGVYCLNRIDGGFLWFTPTTSDVNEICLAGSHLLAPTDAGDLFVLEAATGNIVAAYRADSAVLGKPVVTEEVSGWTAVFASLSGTIYLIEEHSQTLAVLGDIGGGLRAALLRLSASELLAATENGRLIKATIRGRELHSYELAHVPPDTNWGDEVSLTATPLLVGTKIFAGYARTTYSTDPAIFCFDLNEERVEWTARSYEEPEITFGNIRTTPALIGNRLLVASAYTNGVDILDAQSGRFLQRIALGQEVFQQWSSPVQIDEGRAALGRVDGVCSILDVAAGSLAASISLTTAESERFSAGSGDGKAGESFPLYPGDPAPDGGICGTPLIDREMLFVGTTDGVVIGVNLNPRPPYQ